MGVVVEVDPICALQAAMEGYEVKRLESIIKTGDIFITATGNKGIIMAHHMAQMKNNAIVGNIGHFDNEIDMDGLDGYPGIKCVNIKEQVDRYEFPDNHGVIILAQGRLLNLGCPPDIPLSSCRALSPTRCSPRSSSGLTVTTRSTSVERSTSPPRSLTRRSPASISPPSTPSSPNSAKSRPTTSAFPSTDPSRRRLTGTEEKRKEINTIILHSRKLVDFL